MPVKKEDLIKLQMQETYDELGIKLQWKPDHKAGGKMVMIAYHDARDVQKVLDHVCGIENWQNEPRNIDGKLFMGIGINIEGEGWIWKFDIGTEKEPSQKLNKTQQDSIRFKGQASDALKRAGYQLGIFRSDYEQPEVLLPVNGNGVVMTLGENPKPLYSREQWSAYCNGINHGTGMLGRIYMEYRKEIDANPRVFESLKTLGEFLKTIKD